MTAGPAAPPDYAYYRDLFRGRAMPFAFVDLDLFDLNAATIAGRAGGKSVRIASKSLRCVTLLERVLARGAPFAGVLAYDADEAVHLCGRGLDDLVVAYPVWDEGRIRRVGERVRAGKRLALMVDSPEHAVRLGSIARSMDVILPVCLDLDMSSRWPGLHFGVRRSPIGGVAGALAVVEAVEGQKHLRLDGLMGYEAQIAGLPDRSAGAPLRSAAVRVLKRRSIREVAERRAAVVAAIQGRGHRLRFVNGGGTGSLESTRQEACVTEVTAGSGFYAPGLFDGYRLFRHRPAAGFAIEITRRPSPGVYTCHGGGYVASGAAGRDKLPSPYLPPGCALLANEGAGEVQTPIAYRGPEHLSLGDPILLRHAKAGELCERFPSLVLVSRGAVVGEAPTYRGEGWCFL
jgi:D-serine deaminase-like pyridoxal phosphate-dependent protein